MKRDRLIVNWRLLARRIQSTSNVSRWLLNGVTVRENIYNTDLREDIFNLWKNCLQTHEQLWLEIAEKVTMCVQQIIEFAKMVPGFMSLLQDDQIMLLKGKIVGSTFRVKFLQKKPVLWPLFSLHVLWSRKKVFLSRTYIIKY